MCSFRCIHGGVIIIKSDFLFPLLVVVILFLVDKPSRALPSSRYFSSNAERADLMLPKPSRRHWFGKWESCAFVLELLHDITLGRCTSRV